MLPARWQTAPRGVDMQNAFQSWIGQKVVVQLAFGPAKVSLRGMFLRDQEKSLLMRPEAGPDIEIAKTRVLAIEEVKRAPIVSLGARLNQLHRVWVDQGNSSSKRRG
jgi:hypothetical protein